MKILWPTGTMSFVKRGKLLALLLTFINLIALKIYENEILEDSLINNFSNYLVIRLFWRKCERIGNKSL